VFHSEEDVSWQIAFMSSRASAELPGRLMELVRIPLNDILRL